MSMDLSVWSSRPFDIGDLPDNVSWRQYPRSCSHESDDWVIHVCLSNDTKDDRPEFVDKLLPNATHVAYVTLEPIGADESAYALLERTVRHLARRINGVWINGLGTHAYLADDGVF